jgi:hypothetical protein
MPLTSSQARTFDLYERLFAEEGWKELVEDFKERQLRLANHLISDARATDKDMYQAQGMNNVYTYVITLEAIMETAKRQALEREDYLPDVIN